MNVKTNDSVIKNQPQICRLCLAFTTTCYSLIEDTKVSGMLEALTSLRISPSDDISTITCLKCCLNLKLAFTIQQNMLKAEQRFRQHRFLTPVKQEYDTENVEDQFETNSVKLDHPESSEQYTCEACGKKWSSKMDLRKHHGAVHVQVDCSVCGKTLKKGSIKRHMDDKHATTGESLICDICGIPKASKVSLYKHKHCVHRLIKCTICGKEVKSASLKKHVATHKSVTDLTKVENVESEAALRNPQIEYVCDICGKLKPSKTALNAHKYSVHVEGECPICKKRISQANLKRHIERHTDPHTVCDLCGISVLQQDLRVHRYNVHTVRQLKCHFCDKVFKKNYSRTMHEKREHLDEANFTCDTCGKRFYQNAFLKKHIESKHLKKRPHICDFCKVGFSSRFALKTHIRQHTNEKPFKCEFCGDGFRQKVSLKSHLRSQHDVKEELICECKVCGRKFASSIALLSHKRIH